MKIIDIDIVVPILVREIKPNSIIIPAPEILSVGSSSIEVSQSFQCDVDYLGGIVCDTDLQATEATFKKNPGTIVQSISGLHNDTDYYIKGAGLPVLGNFTYGEGVKVHTIANPIPEEYQLVEWIKSIGGYFDNIPIIPDNLTDYELTFMIDSAGGTGSGYFTGVVGARVSYANRNNDLDCSWNRDAYAGWEYNGFTTFPMIYGNKIKMKSDSGKLYFNDALVADRSSQSSISWNAGYNCGLFCKGGVPDTYNPKMTFYDNFKIRHNRELVFDLYPVYRKSDNYVGLYCILTRQFIPSTVNLFLVGPDKEWEE